MNTDAIAKRVAWIACCVLTATVCAMPTKQQLTQAQQLVNDLTADDLRALKSKEKTPGDVAAAHLALADKADTEAGKYLLLQGAFRLYARSGDYDAAAATLQRMRGEIAGLPPEVIVEIVNNEMRRVAASKAPKVLAIFRDAQRMIKYRKQLAAAELDATAHPESARYQRRVAECHACLGDWQKALPIFAKLGDVAAKWEFGTAKDCDAAKAADFWWNYKAADIEPFKAHAASLYRAALDANQVSGLRREVAAKRLAEFEASGVPIPAAATGAPASASAVSAGAQKAPAPTTGPWAIPANFKAPLVRTLKLADGVDMDFCAIPAGSFKMSNADGKSTHKVTITRPFWMGKKFLSLYGIKPHEKRDNATREVMKAFPKYDVLRMSNHDETTKLCYELTVKYRDEIPKGYVFRLPTEAELEYAVTGGNGASKNSGKESFESHIMSMNAYKAKGLTKGDAGIYHWVRLVPKDAFNKWGLTGAGWLLGSAQEILDRYDGRAEDISYEREETDPLRWRGALMCRFGHIDRRNYDGSGIAYQRLVIAPDLETEKWTEYTARNNKPDAKVKSHVIKLNNTVSMEFVECPAGSFVMGWSDDINHVRKHKVTITRPFWIAKTKLTVEQVKAWQKKYQPPKEALAMGGDKIPVAGVLWKDAKFNLEEYCDYLTKKYRSSIPRGYVFRLPTEAEWEYAYTAGEDDANNFYAQFRNIDGEGVESKLGFSTKAINKIAESKGLKPTHDWDRSGVAVAQLPPNRWGLYDMAGNTPELMLDSFDHDRFAHGWAFDNDKQTALIYEDEEVDPLRIAPASAKRTNHILRGGDIGKKWKRQSTPANSMRLVVGPDLIAEKKKAGKK